MGGSATPTPTSIATAISTAVTEAMDSSSGFDPGLIVLIAGVALLVVAAWLAFTRRQKA